MIEKKSSYIAFGIMISLFASFIFEFLAFVGGLGFLFEKSPSGLKYSFALLPVFLVLGILGGYIGWKLRDEKEKSNDLF